MAFNIFKTNQELTDAKAENARLLKLLAEKETEITQLSETIDKITESNLDLTKQVETLKGEIEAAKKSAGAQAANILATVGVPEGTIKPETEAAPALTPDEAMKQFNALSDPLARRAFWAKHKELLKLSK